LTRAQELTLAVGTTAGVAVLSLSLLVPLHRAGVRLRVALEFPPGVRQRAVRLALAGIAALAAQQLSLVVVLRLSYGGPAGTLVLYQLGWTVFLLPWAVLSVPLATSAFPHLVVRHESGDLAGFAALAALTSRTVLLVSGMAAAVLVAAAEPIARLLALHARGVHSPSTLAGAIVAFAPGLLGYGLVAHVGRALYACGQGRRAAIATVTGWIAVLVGDLVLSAAAPASRRLDALAWGNTFGMTIAGVGLLLALSAEARAAVAGLRRTLPTVLVAAVASGGSGYVLARLLSTSGLWLALVTAVAVSGWVVVVFVGIARAGDPVAVRALLGRSGAGVA
jgi:putative peptidoglycan lipid II flippase